MHTRLLALVFIVALVPAAQALCGADGTTTNCFPVISVHSFLPLPNQCNNPQPENQPTVAQFAMSPWQDGIAYMSLVQQLNCQGSLGCATLDTVIVNKQINSITSRATNITDIVVGQVMDPRPGTMNGYFALTTLCPSLTTSGSGASAGTLTTNPAMTGTTANNGNSGDSQDAAAANAWSRAPGGTYAQGTGEAGTTTGASRRGHEYEGDFGGADARDVAGVYTYLVKLDVDPGNRMPIPVLAETGSLGPDSANISFIANDYTNVYLLDSFVTLYRVPMDNFAAATTFDLSDLIPGAGTALLPQFFVVSNATGFAYIGTTVCKPGTTFCVYQLDLSNLAAPVSYTQCYAINGYGNQATATLSQSGDWLHVFISNSNANSNTLVIVDTTKPSGQGNTPMPFPATGGATTGIVPLFMAVDPTDTYLVIGLSSGQGQLACPADGWNCIDDLTATGDCYPQDQGTQCTGTGVMVIPMATVMATASGSSPVTAQAGGVATGMTPVMYVPETGSPQPPTYGIISFSSALTYVYFGGISNGADTAVYFQLNLAYPLNNGDMNDTNPPPYQPAKSKPDTILIVGIVLFVVAAIFVALVVYRYYIRKRPFGSVEERRPLNPTIH